MPLFVKNAWFIFSDFLKYLENFMNLLKFSVISRNN